MVEYTAKMIGYVIKDVNRQFRAVAYNIFQKEFKNLSKRIEKKLDSVVRAHQLIQDEATDFAEQGIKIMTRCKFQIRCKANEISSELLHKNYKNVLLEESNDAQENLCSENVSETNDYQFNMELSVKVRSYRQPYDHKEYKIWVEENESTIKITNNMKHFD
ncbi:hypothetical protein C0J52_19938 [Blattella germanica]|nr:hypothetical protein C0J52_19938 [Blattella germanica]